MLRLCLLVASLLWPLGPALADIPRPLDERATARLIADEVARQEPEARVERSDTRWWITLHMPDGQQTRIVVEEFHQSLRAAGDGASRQAMLQDFVFAQLLSAKEESVQEPKRGPVVDLKLAMPVLRPFVPAEPPKTVADSLGLALAPVGRPFQSGLIQCWTVEALPTGFDCVNGIHLNGMTEEDLAGMALANLQRHVGKEVTTLSGPFHKVSFGPKFASSLMLLDDYWQRRARDGRLVAAIPVANELIWITNPSEAELAELRQRTDAAFRAGGVTMTSPTGDKVMEAVSPDLYLWTGEGWEILPP